MSEFGDSVRQARLSRGLSQAELGAPHYSRSYISLVETGRRAPSDDIVEHVASRLDIDTEVVRSWALAQGDTGTTRAALAQAAVLTALSRSAYDEASRAAVQLSEFALDAGRLDLWWTATYLEIDTRAEMGEPEEAVKIAEDLLDHWFTASSPVLTSTVLTSLSIAVRVSADFDRAIALARRAVDCLRAGGDDKPADATAALTALVSALAEAGRVDEAYTLVPDLRRSAETSSSRVDAGKAYWAAGNLAFMCNDPKTGLQDHGRAMERIDPNHDLRRWARLLRASATMRVNAGVALDSVPDLLSRAESAFGISAGPADMPTLAIAQGTYASLVEDWETARERLEFALADPDLLTAPMCAEAHRKLATALQHLGEHAEAARHLSLALELVSPSQNGLGRAG